LLSIEIYDRWGRVQFSTKDSPFLGLNNNGNELDGVFTYRVYFRELIKNSFQEKIGSVVVVRENVYIFGEIKNQRLTCKPLSKP
jgi:hypothetical protein